MLRTTLRAAGLAAALVAATAVPASAARLAVADPVGDVYTYSEDGTGYTLLGTRVNADVTKTIIRHTRSRVSVKSRYTDLVANKDTIMFGAALKTNEGLRRDVYVMAGAGKRKGVVSFGKRTGKEVPCKGLTHSIDYAANTIQLSVPRSCLSGPRWVRMQGGAVAFQGMEDFAVDDAQRPDVTDGNTWGKRVRVG